MRTILAALPLCLLLAACAPAASEPAIASTEADAVAAVVQNFGSRLKNVSLLAPDAAQQIQTQYAEFVTPELLAAWMADPMQAPGRLTSSPWPDRIEIDAIHSIGPTLYQLVARVIEITSAEVGTDKIVASYSVSLTVRQTGGQWLISDYKIIEGP
jgi:hypothetical protein